MRAVLLLWLCFLLLPFAARSQDVEIELGKKELAQNETFRITVKVNNQQVRSYGGFPDLPGFEKAGISTATSTQVTNGRRTFTQKITQNYQPRRQGTFSFPGFNMKINGKRLRGPGATLKVGPPKKQKAQRGRKGFSSPFDNFFGRNRQPQNFREVEDNAFFALTPNKNEVYIGEGFNVVAAFYVARDNRAEMQFYDLGSQLNQMVKELKPENCWEENFNIDEIEPKRVTINGKQYTQYRIFQASYFPLNSESVQFPSLGLKMIKYRVAKQRTFFGRNRQQDFKTFYSSPKTVEVKKLPPHPLRERVAVGQYNLQESIDKHKAKTGQSLNYLFKIEGKGNIAQVPQPQLPETEDFQIYSPNIQQTVKRHYSRVDGSKAFKYVMVPQEAGDYELGEYFQWVYFDPERQVYDTLRSEMALHASGESQKNLAISGQSNDNFYQLIASQSNTLYRMGRSNRYRLFGNLAFGMLALGAIVLFILQRRKRNTEHGESMG